MHRLRASMMSRSHLAPRADVNWARIIFRYTDDKTRSFLAQLQHKFTEVATMSAALPKAVKPIDWDYWKKTIRTKGVVDQFEQEYNAEMKKEIKINPTDIESARRKQETEIRAIEEKASTSAEFLRELKSEIGWTQKWYDNTEQVIAGTWISWNKFKVDHYYPAYKIHRMNRVLFLGDPTQRMVREVDKINSVDLPELRKQLNNGNIRAMAAIVPIKEGVGDVSALQRPFAKKWLKDVNYEEAFKNPNASLVYRAFALRQILEPNR